MEFRTSRNRFSDKYTPEMVKTNIFVKDTFVEILTSCQWQASSVLDQKPLLLADRESHVEQSAMKYTMH